MNLTIRRYEVLALALFIALGVAGCDEALFTANTEDAIPTIPDEGTPWVEFVGDDAVAVLPGESVVLAIELGEAIGEEVTVAYEVSGDAVAGTDYDITSGASPVTVPFDPADNNPDQANIEIIVLSGATPGRALTVTLTSATSETGQSLDVGRGGTDIDKSRTVEIAAP